LLNTDVAEVVFPYRNGAISPHADIKGFSYKLSRTDYCTEVNIQQQNELDCLTVTVTTLRNSDAIFSFERIQDGYATAERYVAWLPRENDQYERVFQQSRLKASNLNIESLGFG